MLYLKDVGDGVLSINLLLHDTILVDTNGRQKIQHALVHWLETIDNECDGNLLPSWFTLFCVPAPELRLLRPTYITDIEHDTMQSSRVKSLVFIIGGHCNQNLRLAVVDLCAQRIAVGLGEFIGITRCGSVAHMPMERV